MIRDQKSVDYSTPAIDAKALDSNRQFLRLGSKVIEADDPARKLSIRTTGNAVQYLTGEVLTTDHMEPGETIAFLPSGLEAVYSANYEGVSVNQNTWEASKFGTASSQSALYEMATNQGSTGTNIRYIASGHVIVHGGSDLTKYYGSLDGIDWELFEVSSAVIPTTHVMKGIIWDTSLLKYIMVGGEANILTSTTGRVWVRVNSGGSFTLNAVTEDAAGGRYVAVGDNGTVYNSFDSITWTARSSGTTNDLNAVIYSGANFVAVGDNGVITISADLGITWALSPDSGFQPNGLYALLEHAGTDLIAVGSNSTVIKSGIGGGGSWSSQATTGLSAINFRTVSQNGAGLFAAAGTDGRITTTLDFVTFIDQVSNTGHSLLGSTFGDDTFFISGFGDTLVKSIIPGTTRLPFPVEITGNKIVSTTHIDGAFSLKFDGITFIAKEEA